MAYYKVPQDVEAEDKLVFGLTFKQFIFALVFFIAGFVGFQLARRSLILAGPILPILIISGILAFYKPKDQAAETKLLSYVNFWFRPRARTWSRDGLLERVHIQAPRLTQAPMITRSREQVRSQLKTLAQIVDTRGWSVKQSAIQSPTVGMPYIVADDRLIAPQEVEVVGEAMAPAEEALDIMDVAASPVAKTFQRLSAASDERHRQEVIERMQHAGETVAEPHFDPFPNRMRQKVISPGGEPQLPKTPDARKKLAELDDITVEGIAQQADRIDRQSEAEFSVEH
jgi:hypothetical protein